MILIIGLFFALSPAAFGKKSLFENSDSLNRQRIWALGTTTSAGTGITLGILSKAWYSDYDIVPFHFFNDAQDWLGIDKLGHSLSAFYGGLYGYNALKWTGLSEKKSVWIGGLYGYAFLLVTETFDGFSSGWGASPADLLANTIGTGLFIGQQLGFKKQIIVPKFSFSYTNFAQYRPNLLGSSYYDRWLKDYNGQTYWLSASFSDLNINSKYIPTWLALSIGYGADGMLGGFTNPIINADGITLPYFERTRAYYLSFDINWLKIKTKSHFWNAFLKGMSFVKFPFPAVGYERGRWVAKPLHY